MSLSHHRYLRTSPVRGFHGNGFYKFFGLLFSKSAHILMSVKLRIRCTGNTLAGDLDPFSDLIMFPWEKCRLQQPLPFLHIIKPQSTLYMYLWYHGIMCNRNSRRFILFAGAIIPIYEIIDRVWTISFHAHAFNIGDFLTGTGRDNLVIHKNTYSVWTERRFGCFKSNITCM